MHIRGYITEINLQLNSLEYQKIIFSLASHQIVNLDSLKDKHKERALKLNSIPLVKLKDADSMKNCIQITD